MERAEMQFGHAIMAGLLLAFLASGSGAGQPAGTPPPAVGVVAVTRQPVTRSSEFIGRIQATNRVDIVARVAAFLDEMLFTEGAEVKKGDLLYRLEQGPFRADVQAKQAAIAQFQAQLKNAQVTLERARTLLRTPAGQQSAVDTAVANQQALTAQVLGAEAQLQQSKINLDYTEIRAPIDGKIGRTAVTVGNYVNAATGILVSIVSQDPMYVLFPVSTRTVVDLLHRLAVQPDAVVIKLRLRDGSIYRQTGRLDFVDNSVARNTDTMTLRGVLPNPRLGNVGARELVDGEFVTVILEDAEPTETLAIPRAAVLSDQKGDYVYVVSLDNKAEQRRITLGQSTPMTAAVINGLQEGEKVILDGIQRVRPDQLVSPGPAASRVQPSTSATPANDAAPRQ